MKNLLRTIALTLMSALSCGVAMAEGTDYTFGLTPYAGYHFIYDRDYKDSPEAGLRAEMFFGPRWSAELGAGYMRVERESTGDKKDSLTYMLNAVYNLTVSGKVIPYLAAGIGGDYTDGKSLTGPDAGIGARIFLTDNLALRPEVRYIYLFEGQDDVVATLGLSFLFGKTAPAPVQVLDSDKDGVPDDVDKCPGTPSGVKVDPVGCPLDSDKDGVPDYLDKCPGTPSGVKVDAVGCPLDSDKDGVPDYLDKCPGTPSGVKVDAVGCPLDSDKDGVPDYLDKCPDTPAGVKVDAAGCPLDSDKDGVPDYLDKCPGTPAGAKVDKVGCVVSITLKVIFDTNKAVVKQEYFPEIEQFADFMKQYPDVKAEIQGHTDSSGNSQKNLTLSDARANAVRDVVISKFGIAANRLTAKGYGQEKPVASNDTPEGREKNRRVEAVVIK